MARVVLIHWNAQEAEPCLQRLRRAGHQAERIAPRGGDGLRRFRQAPPDAFVIDLSRLPSRGRDVGIFLRQQKPTRPVPLIFAGGEAEKVERIRCVLPDATYTGWPGVGRALKQALAQPLVNPVVVGPMAGYSGTPLPKKLGIKPGSVVVLLEAPARFERRLEPLPEGARVLERGRDADRVLLFARSLEELGRRFAAAAAAVKPGGGLWLIWPKKTSGIAGDLGEAVVRKAGLEAGWVDYKVCAVDETWSGLLFARRFGGTL